MRVVLCLCLVGILCGCFDSPVSEYPQRIVGTWRIAGPVMGESVASVLYILPEGSYILNEQGTPAVANIAAPDKGKWALVHDELELLALQASPLSQMQFDPPKPARLQIVSLDEQTLVTTDPTYGVRIEWSRISPLN
jgi:hypothetical protein